MPLAPPPSPRTPPLFYTAVSSFELTGSVANSGDGYHMAMSGDGQRLLAGGSHTKMELYQWDDALAASADGRQLASASADGTVRVWDAAYGLFGLETQPCRATLPGHAGAVHARLLAHGGVLSCGHNAAGQLGHGSQRSFAPERVPFPGDDRTVIVGAAAGYAHNASLFSTMNRAPEDAFTQLLGPTRICLTTVGVTTSHAERPASSVWRLRQRWSRSALRFH